MEIIYEVTADDYYNFGRENSRSQAEFQPTVIILTLTILIFIFADLIYSYFLGALKYLNPEWVILNIIARLFLSIILMLLVMITFNLIVGRKKRKIEEMSKNASLCEHKLILTEKELIEITDLYTNRSSWKAIGEIKESDNFLFFGSAMAHTYIIPKKYFGDRKQVKDFVNTYNTYRQKSLNEYRPSYFVVLDKSKNENS